MRARPHASGYPDGLLGALLRLRTDLRERIEALINARKVAGVHAGSAVDLQDNARSSGVYAARVVGRRGDLYVRLGGTDAEWEPSRSHYSGYREYAKGAGWKVWVGLQNRMRIPP